MKSFATRYFNLSGGSNGSGIGVGGYSASRRDVPPDGTPGTFRFIGEDEPDVGAESLLGSVAGRRLGQAGSKGRPLSQEVSLDSFFFCPAVSNPILFFVLICAGTPPLATPPVRNVPARPAQSAHPGSLALPLRVPGRLLVSIVARLYLRELPSS